jgi:predicted PurR-regulated permease PerM
MAFAMQDQLERRQDTSVRVPSRTAALWILATLALIFALRYAQEVFIPIVLAILIQYMLDPMVTWASRFRIPRYVSAAVVLVGLTAALGAGVYSLRDEAARTLEQLPEAARRIRQALRSRGAPDTPVEKVQQAAGEIERAASEAAGSTPAPAGVTRVQVEEPAFRASEYLWTGSRNAVTIAGQGVVVFFLVYFLLAAGDSYRRKLVRIAGTRLAEKKVTVQILAEINLQIGRFLLVQVITSLIVAVATWLALSYLGLKQAAIWGVAAGVFNTIPYFGAILVTAALAVVAFLQFGTLAMAAYVAGVAFVITSLEGFLLTPALMGKAAGINQVALFISLLFWTWVWGIVGTILAVPIMMAIKTICDRIEGFQPVAELLGEEPARPMP